MNNGPEWMSKFESGDGNSPELATLERELTAALRPIEMPVGLADRIVAASRAQPQRAKVISFRSWRWVAGSAIAASVLAGSFVAQDIHERREREREQKSEQQFETAMRVTYKALGQTREQLAKAGIRFAE